MPKIAEEWGALQVKQAKHPGGPNPVVYAVGGVSGLYLQITPKGGKSWILRYQIAGKRRNMGLGGYPTTTLATARERAKEYHDMIWRGEDPIHAKRAARAAQARSVTFAEAFEAFFKIKAPELRNERSRKQWRAPIDRHAMPVLGELPVNTITREDVLRVLSPIWDKQTVTAKKVQQRIAATLGWAEAHGHRSGDNPATWDNLKHTLPAANRIRKKTHHPALQLSDAPAWFADLRSRTGIATRALEFCALTAARSGDVRGMTWDEVDLETGLWVISADRMKAEAEHRVALSPQAVNLLRALPRLDGSPFVFPAARGGMLTDMALSATMRRMNAAREGGYLDARSGRPAVPHGLRSTFRDWAAERTEYPRDMAEIALAHTVGSEVERAYRRSDMVERRRAMMAAWARFLEGRQSEKVVRLEAAR